MTALAVFGLACTFFVATRNQGLELEARADSVKIDRLTNEIEILKQKVDSLGPGQDNEDVLEFLPCWPKNESPRYYVTYDLTVRGGAFTFSPHEDWGAGSDFRDTLPFSVLSSLESLPAEAATPERAASFGRSVFRVLDGEDYPRDCKLVVTINREATGFEISALTRVRFYPIYR